ncbi:MAG: hypothetical protein RJA36_2836, partial [Pseudomonadota bacterium]
MTRRPPRSPAAHCLPGGLSVP